MFDYVERHFSRLWFFVFSIDFMVLLFTSLITLKILNSVFFNNNDIIYTNLGIFYLITFIFISQIILFINELYSVEKSHKKTWLAFKCIVSFFIVSIGLYFLFSNVLSYFNCFVISMGACGAILFWRLLFDWIIPKINLQHRVLFLGTNELSKRAVKEILTDDHPKFKVVGFVGDDPSQFGKDIDDTKVLGLVEDLDAIVQREKVEKIVISLPKNERGGFLANNLIRCKFKGLDIMDLHTFYEKLKGKILLEGLLPNWLIFAHGFKKSVWIRLEKRILDVILSIIGLLTSLPISIITALLIKLESKGPILYKQERVGENGRIFNLYKFRSMRTDAEKESGPVWAKENDPRVTRIGSFIRKVRIDEIPQMINVLKGDMSFVGPRPERPHFVEMLNRQIPYYDQRHSIKPGITGWAAVNYSYGATVEDAVEKLQYDFYYIKNSSLFLDLITILKTVTIVFGRRGAR